MRTSGHLEVISGGGEDAPPVQPEVEREALEELEHLSATWADRLPADSRARTIFLEIATTRLACFGPTPRG